MEIEQYILNQDLSRQNLLAKIHGIIVAADKMVVPVVEPMMGKDMIVYKGKGLMKYGLASVKNYMSLHVLPIYGSKELYTKYQILLSKANFQKGCINFKKEEEMPLEIVEQLMLDCASIDLLKIKEDYIKSRKDAELRNR